MGQPAEKLSEHFPQLGNVKRGTHKPRPPIFLRDWSNAQRLMKDHHITNDAVAKEGRLTKSTVNRALNFAAYHKCQYLLLMKTRATVELMLSDAGAEFNALTLWQDYDLRLAELM